MIANSKSTFTVLTAQEVAEIMRKSKTWVYDHADELGASRRGMSIASHAGDRGSTPLGTMRFSSFSKDPRGTVWGTGDFFYLHLREIWHTPRDSYGTVGCEKIVTG